MTQSFDELEVLFYEESPYGNLAALVQCDERTIYFYLQGDASFGTRACWVANLQPGPWVFSEDDLCAGRPPLLPRIHVGPHACRKKPTADELRVVWFPEGNGAYLLWCEEIAAIIPPWSGQDGFHGYARDCTSDNLVCSPLPPSDELRVALNEAQSFWNAWTDGRVFKRAQPEILRAYEGVFGEAVQYYAIDGGKFPPRGAACFRHASQWIIASVGMSLCPQPNVPRHDNQDARHARWIELAMRVDGSVDWQQIQTRVQTLSGIVKLPWHRWTWLGSGQSIEISNDNGPPLKYRLAADCFEPTPASPPFPQPFGQLVHLLWLHPTA